MNEYLRDINDLLSAIVVVIFAIAAIGFICGVVASVLKKRSAELEAAQAELELKYATGPLPIRMSNSDLINYLLFCEVYRDSQKKILDMHKKYEGETGIPDITLHRDGTITKN